MALVSMALGACGVEAASFTGSQAGIITDTDHTRAKILEMRPDRIAMHSMQDSCRSSPDFKAFPPSATSRPCRGGSDVTASRSRRP